MRVCGARGLQALGVLVLADGRDRVEAELAQVQDGGLADAGRGAGHEHCSGGHRAGPYPLASPGWTSTTPSGPAARTRPTGPSRFRARRSTSCSSSRAGRRTTTSRTRGASACSGRSRSRGSRRPPRRPPPSSTARPRSSWPRWSETGDPVQDEEDYAPRPWRLHRAARRARPRAGGLLAHARRAAHAGGALGRRRPRRRARDRPAPPGPAPPGEGAAWSGCRPATS